MLHLVAHTFLQKWGNYGNKKQKKTDNLAIISLFGTQTRGRTGMEVNPLVFETSASTDSAIWAMAFFSKA